MRKPKILRQKTDLVKYAMDVLVPPYKRGTGDINRSINKKIETAVRYTVDLTKRWHALKKPSPNKQQQSLSPLKMYRFFFDTENIGMISTYFMARIFPIMRKYKALRNPMRLFIMTYLHTNKMATRDEMSKGLSRMKVKIIGQKLGYELNNLTKSGLISKHPQIINGKDKSMFKLTVEGQKAADELLNKSVVYDCMKYAGIKRNMKRSRSQRDKKLKRRYYKDKN